MNEDQKLYNIYKDFINNLYKNNEDIKIKEENIYNFEINSVSYLFKKNLEELKKYYISNEYSLTEEDENLKKEYKNSILYAANSDEIFKIITNIIILEAKEYFELERENLKRRLNSEELIPYVYIDITKTNYFKKNYIEKFKSQYNFYICEDKDNITHFLNKDNKIMPCIKNEKYENYIKFNFNIQKPPKFKHFKKEDPSFTNLYYLEKDEIINEQCICRKSHFRFNEDLVHINENFFVVIDGHSGDLGYFTSFGSLFIFYKLIELLDILYYNITESNIYNIINVLFLELEKEIRYNISNQSGACVAIGIIYNNTLYTAMCGNIMVDLYNHINKDWDRLSNKNPSFFENSIIKDESIENVNVVGDINSKNDKKTYMYPIIKEHKLSNYNLISIQTDGFYEDIDKDNFFEIIKDISYEYLFSYNIDKLDTFLNTVYKTDISNYFKLYNSSMEGIDMENLMDDNVGKFFYSDLYIKDIEPEEQDDIFKYDIGYVSYFIEYIMKNPLEKFVVFNCDSRYYSLYEDRLFIKNIDKKKNETAVFKSNFLIDNLVMKRSDGDIMAIAINNDNFKKKIYDDITSVDLNIKMNINDL